jgi:general secretion pathway protein J
MDLESGASSDREGRKRRADRGEPFGSHHGVQTSLGDRKSDVINDKDHGVGGRRSMKKRVHDGFTLFELLLAVSLLSLITSSILGGLHLGRRAWESTRASDAIDDVENAARAVAAQLSKSYPALQGKSNASPAVAFQGLANASRSVMLSDGGAQWGGLILTEIGSVASRNGVDLAIWTRVYREAEGVSPAREEMRMTPLLRDLAYFQLSYFGWVERDRPPLWTDSWVDRAEPPLLISIKIGANRLGRVISASSTVAIRQR